MRAGILSFEIGREKIQFNFSKMVKTLALEDDFDIVDEVKFIEHEHMMSIISDDPMELCLISSASELAIEHISAIKDLEF